MVRKWLLLQTKYLTCLSLPGSQGFLLPDESDSECEEPLPCNSSTLHQSSQPIASEDSDSSDEEGVYNRIYVTGSAKRYTNAQAIIFLYKRCCSKTRNIFYSLKKLGGGGGGAWVSITLCTDSVFFSLLLDALTYSCPVTPQCTSSP